MDRYLVLLALAGQGLSLPEMWNLFRRKIEGAAVNDRQALIKMVKELEAEGLVAREEGKLVLTDLAREKLKKDKVLKFLARQRRMLKT